MGKTFVQDHCKRPDQMAGDYTEKNLYKKKLKKNAYIKRERVWDSSYPFLSSGGVTKKKGDRKDSAAES